MPGPNHMVTPPKFIVQRIPIVASNCIAELTLPINKHIHDVLSNGNPESAKRIWDWIGSIFQFPDKKTNETLVFYGPRGVGKDLLWKWIKEELVGNDASRDITNAVFTTDADFITHDFVVSDDMLMFECSSVYRGNTEYFKWLTEHMKRPDVQRALVVYSPAPKNREDRRGNSRNADA